MDNLLFLQFMQQSN